MGYEWTKHRDDVVLSALRRGAPLAFALKELRDTTMETLRFGDVLDRAKELIAAKKHTPVRRVVVRETISEKSLDYLESRSAPVLRIRFDECKWPIGDPRKANFRFCCEPVRRGGRQPYCARHAAISLRQIVPGRPRAQFAEAAE